MGSSKRARTAAVHNFDSISCDKISLGLEGEPLLDGDVPRINLTPTGFLNVRYGFNLSGVYEKPNFLVPDSDSKAGFLSIRVALDKAQLDFLNAFDAKCRQTYLETHSDDEWFPLTSHIEREDLWTVKIKVYFQGTVTLMRVWEKEGPVLAGDWEQARELMESNSCFYRADVKLVVKPQRIWTYNGKAGLCLMATQLALRPAVVPPEIDVFVEAEW